MLLRKGCICGHTALSCTACEKCCLTGWLNFYKRDTRDNLQLQNSRCPLLLHRFHKIIQMIRTKGVKSLVSWSFPARFSGKRIVESMKVEPWIKETQSPPSPQTDKGQDSHACYVCMRKLLTHAVIKAGYTKSYDRAELQGRNKNQNKNWCVMRFWYLRIYQICVWFKISGLTWHMYFADLLHFLNSKSLIWGICSF